MASKSTALYDIWLTLVRPEDLIVDHKIAYKVQSVDDIPKCREAFIKLKHLVGDSLILSEGNKWHKLRKMFNPGFMQAHLETLVPQITEEILIFIEKLEKAGEMGAIISINQELTVNTAIYELTFKELALDIIGRYRD